jgi:hypothetical protein
MPCLTNPSFLSDAVPSGTGCVCAAFLGWES